MKFWVAIDEVEASGRIPGTEDLSSPALTRVIRPDSEYHLVSDDGKFLCGISKVWAMKLAGVRSCMFLAKIPTQLVCCANCDKEYRKSDSSELRRLNAWNNGKPKIFSTELNSGSRYGKTEPTKKKVEDRGR